MQQKYYLTNVKCFLAGKWSGVWSYWLAPNWGGFGESDMYQFYSGGHVFIYAISILPGYTFDYVMPTKHFLRQSWEFALI